MLITVRCADEFDPPQIQITIAGEVPFQVSMGVYQYLRTVIPGLPDDPCAGIGE